MVNSLFAQPIHDSTWLPSAGNIFQFNEVYNLMDYIESDSADKDTGANVTWHFEHAFVNTGYYSDSIIYVNSNTIPCTSGSSNLGRGNFNDYSYYLKSSKGLFLLSSKHIYPGVGFSEYVYSKPEVIIRSNFQFRQEYYDTIICRSVDLTHDSPYRSHSYRYKKYDGYGILKFADKTYDSAIRIKTISFTKDSIYLNSGYYYIITGYKSYE